MRDPYNELAKRYLEILKKVDNFGSWYTSKEHLENMLRKLQEFDDREKKARWIGYVQGVLVAEGIIDLEEEILFCRKLFKKED